MHCSSWGCQEHSRVDTKVSTVPLSSSNLYSTSHMSNKHLKLTIAKTKLLISQLFPNLILSKFFLMLSKRHHHLRSCSRKKQKYLAIIQYIWISNVNFTLTIYTKFNHSSLCLLLKPRSNLPPYLSCSAKLTCFSALILTL